MGWRDFDKPVKLPDLSREEIRQLILADRIQQQLRQLERQRRMSQVLHFMSLFIKFLVPFTVVSVVIYCIINSFYK